MLQCLVGLSDALADGACLTVGLSDGTADGEPVLSVGLTDGNVEGAGVYCKGGCGVRGTL